MRFITLMAAFAISALPSFAQADRAAAPASQTIIRSTSQEVLLDVVVRDKKGHLVKDLSVKDFEVTDDGEPQKLRSFRLVTASEGAFETTAAGSSATAGAAGKPSGAIDPLRQIRIITLVFDRLGTEARTTARTAVNDLLKSETGPNLFFAVFSIDQRLSILQQYTTDKDLVRKAVAKVTSSASSLYKSESDQIEQELKTVAVQNAANASVATPAAAPPNAGALASAALAQLTLNMLQFSQTLDRTLQGRSTLYALKALINQQYQLPGRKTLLFFCEGMNIPPEYTEEFEGLISNANRANVSVYAIDARGLLTSRDTTQSSQMLAQAVAQSQISTTAFGTATTPQQVKAMDKASDSIRANAQNSLAELADSTGGFLVAN
ncbi:MAG: VWA domain-containing protein, partial [Acidobacteriota bacterium]|nr:VWA domain-containing protein [Acidobacteriota bacterium]